MSAAAIQAIASSVNAAGLTSSFTQTQSPLAANLATNLAGLSPATDGTQAMPFADLLVDAVGETNRLQDVARSTVKGLITGTGVDVHEAMIATQKASMSFELALSVRNKAVQAYQQVMSMQF